jgi:hypothetical protein
MGSSYISNHIHVVFQHKKPRAPGGPRFRPVLAKRGDELDFCQITVFG